MIALLSLLTFSVSEWGVIDLGTGKAISSAGAFREGSEPDMPVVKAPVIYFYGNMPKEMALSLGVSPDKVTIAEPEFVKIKGKPSWKIKPYDAKKGKSVPSCWTDAEALTILANDRACDYIFYEAELSYKNQVRLLQEGGKAGFSNSGKYPVHDVIYLIGYPGTENGIMLSYYIPVLGPSETVWPEQATIPSESEIRRKMVSLGLTDGAAGAFLKEWWPIFALQQEKGEAGMWFQEGSLITSVFAYRLSGEEVDEILPLSVEPKPEKVARVWWVLMK